MIEIGDSFTNIMYAGGPWVLGGTVYYEKSLYYIGVDSNGAEREVWCGRAQKVKHENQDPV